MKKGPLNPKYVRIEVRIGPLTRKTSRIGQVIGIEDRTQVVGLDKTIEIVVPKETLEDMEDKIVGVDIEMIDIMITIEAETGQEKEYLQENYNSSRDRSPSNSRSGSGSRANMNRDRIRCYNCREYDHFARDCPNLGKRESWKACNRCWIWKLKHKPTDKIAP